MTFPRLSVKTAANVNVVSRFAVIFARGLAELIPALRTSVS
jgi:hypothetical protein